MQMRLKVKVIEIKDKLYFLYAIMFLGERLWIRLGKN